MTAAATFDGDAALALPLWSIGHGETVAIVDRCRLIVFHMSAFLWMRWHVAVSLRIVYDMILGALAKIWGKIFIHSNVYVESHCVNFRANVIIVRWRKIFDDASMSHVELCCGFFLVFTLLQILLESTTVHWSLTYSDSSEPQMPSLCVGEWIYNILTLFFSMWIFFFFSALVLTLLINSYRFILCFSQICSLQSCDITRIYISISSNSIQ